MDIEKITVWDGTRFRKAIGKVMTADGLKDFYRPIDFQTDFSATQNMVIQSPKTYLKSAINAGATTLPVQSTTGFFVGQEITVTDGTNQENLRITGISGNHLIVTPTRFSYKLNAIVARSTSVFSSEMTFDARKTYSISIS